MGDENKSADEVVDGALGPSGEVVDQHFPVSMLEMAAPLDQDAPGPTEADMGAEDIATPPVKRKSHRPSLEVVEVQLYSFYDKIAFKQDLQVGEGDVLLYHPFVPPYS